MRSLIFSKVLTLSDFLNLASLNFFTDGWMIKEVNKQNKNQMLFNFIGNQLNFRKVSLIGGNLFTFE